MIEKFDTYPLSEVTKTQEHFTPDGEKYFIWEIQHGITFLVLNSHRGWRLDPARQIIFHQDDPRYKDLAAFDSLKTRLPAAVKAQYPHSAQYCIPTSIRLDPDHISFVKKQKINLSYMIRYLLDYLMTQPTINSEVQSDPDPDQLSI